MATPRRLGARNDGKPGAWNDTPLHLIGQSSNASYFAEAALAAFIFRKSLLNIFEAKIRPQHRSEEKFTVGSLPEKKVAEARLTASAYDQIRVGNARAT